MILIALFLAIILAFVLAIITVILPSKMQLVAMFGFFGATFVLPAFIPDALPSIVIAISRYFYIIFGGVALFLRESGILSMLLDKLRTEIAKWRIENGKEDFQQTTRTIECSWSDADTRDGQKIDCECQIDIEIVDPISHMKFRKARDPFGYVFDAVGKILEQKINRTYYINLLKPFEDGTEFIELPESTLNRIEDLSDFGVKILVVRYKMVEPGKEKTEQKEET
jgi:hypothetical protein